jgi:hypothetical protein
MKNKGMIYFIIARRMETPATLSQLAWAIVAAAKTAVQTGGVRPRRIAQ